MTSLRGTSSEFTNEFALGFYTTAAFFLALMTYMWCYYRNYLKCYTEPYIEMWQDLKSSTHKFTKCDNDHIL
jgi:hypothetical protein